MLLPDFEKRSEFDKAWRKFIFAVIKELKLDKFLDWLIKVLPKEK